MRGISVKINKQGYLLLQRKGVFKEQFCPYQDEVHCADDCPHFGEPEWSKNGGTFYFGLKCCQTVLLVVDLPSYQIGEEEFGTFKFPKEFIDERVHDNKED